MLHNVLFNYRLKQVSQNIYYSTNHRVNNQPKNQPLVKLKFKQIKNLLGKVASCENKKKT